MRLYRHKKGDAYLFLHEATNTETLEELVVYRALYGDMKVWCRPTHIFMEEGRFTEIRPMNLTESEMDCLISTFEAEDI